MKIGLLQPVMLLYCFSFLSGQTFSISGRILEEKADKPILLPLCTLDPTEDKLTLITSVIIHLRQMPVA